MRTDPEPVLPADGYLRSDIEIVSRVLGGDTAAFELIVRRYNERLFRVTRAILRDDAEAEDVMQEAWVRAFLNLSQFAGEAKFSTWLTKIAAYEALGRLRRAKRWEGLPEAMDSSHNPEHTAYRHELEQALEVAVDALPALYRTVFVLREVEEMSVSETAECLGITEDSVKTRSHRARALLRRRLERAIGATAGHTFPFLGGRCDRMTNSVMQRIDAAMRA